MFVFIYTYLYYCFYVVDAEAFFTNVTFKVFGEKIDGLISAFGDINSDTLTDLFILNDNGSVLEILFAQSSPPFFNRSNSISFSSNNPIISVIPGDYNGDSQMDILIVTQLPIKKTVNVQILWTDKMKVFLESYLVTEMQDQPLVMDYNADMIPDIFGEDVNGSRCCWVSSTFKNFSKVCFTNASDVNPISHPHSNAFIDLNQDFGADLFITSQDYSGKKYFEIWDMISHNCINVTSYENASVIGHSTFLDLDADGELELLVPICDSQSCINTSKILAFDFSKNMWHMLTISFQEDGQSWGFLPSELNQGANNTLRVGDYNMDGYPDLLAVLYSLQEKIPRAFLLENIPDTSFPGQRTFKILHTPELNKIENVLIATFYDIQEDGVLDILIVTKNKSYKMFALQNSFSTDTYFVKVIVLSGLCYMDCPDDKVPYGTNQPGPFIRFQTTQSDGSPLISAASQLSQSAYFALQLPYTVFGLGTTPNFVETLQVNIPSNLRQKVRKHEWKSIIPNSQLIIIPHPLDSPNKWISKLFVTPSRLMLMTLAALVGTCVILIGIIGFLQWKERRADRREKLQEAHRFHFDAM